MVADLLQQSLQAHERARILRQKPATREEAKVVLAEARSLRLQALSEDPNMSDPAWASERVPHATMMTFYEGILGEP